MMRAYLVSVRVRARVRVRVRVRVSVRVPHHRDEQVDEQHVGDHDVHPQQHLAALARPRVDVARFEPAEHRPQRRGVHLVRVGLRVGERAEGDHEAALVRVRVAIGLRVRVRVRP